MRYAWQAIRRRPGRSALTSFGVGLATSLVLILLALSAGIQSSADRLVAASGVDLIATSANTSLSSAAFPPSPRRTPSPRRSLGRTRAVKRLSVARELSHVCECLAVRRFERESGTGRLATDQRGIGRMGPPEQRRPGNTGGVRRPRIYGDRGSAFRQWNLSWAEDPCGWCSTRALRASSTSR